MYRCFSKITLNQIKVNNANDCIDYSYGNYEVKNLIATIVVTKLSQLVKNLKLNLII